MRGRYFVDAEELIRKCGGVTPYLRKNYSIDAEELLREGGGVTP